jgi:hypothetical protein
MGQVYSFFEFSVSVPEAAAGLSCLTGEQEKIAAERMPARKIDFIFIRYFYSFKGTQSYDQPA